ncbi:MAG: glycosyltransferase family 2 protein [Deltaproteobacteria bacterium]|nr:glycosyltransferase family 2 protein [Deltaproteobacteria bacterium]
MSILESTFSFAASKGWWGFFLLFWYFFVFGLTRYILLDFFILGVYLRRRKKNRSCHDQARAHLFGEKPLVSVLVPGKNEGRHIPGLATSLQRQSYRNFEIIIVDDGSSDNTPEICRALLRNGTIQRFFRNTRRGGKASAANLALRYARGEFILHVDADSALREDAIERILIPFYLDPQVGGVGGDVRVNNLDWNLVTRLQGIEYMKSISVGRTVTSTLGIMRVISGAYGAFRADILRRLRGWDPGPGLDGDITLKIRKLGFKVVHEPLSVCYTNVPLDFGKLAKQRYRWDRSLVRFRLRKHRDLFSLPSRNFRFLNFLTAAENVLYNFVFNLKWWFYTLQIAFVYTQDLQYILIINLCLYISANFAQFFVGTLFYGRTLRRSELGGILYVPLLPLYSGVFLRVVRTYAHLMELLHKTSYEDPWNPWKVSRLAKREGL